VSFAHRYTARPEPVVRNVVPPALAVVITIAPELPAALPLAADDPPAAGALLLPPLLHAASSAAAMPAPTTATAAPSLAGVVFELRIVIFLQLAERRSAFSFACRSNYAASDGTDWMPGNFFLNGPVSSRTSAD